MNKQVIVKALFGNYDRWADPLIVEEDTDYIVFTDQNIKSELFEIRKTERLKPKYERLIKAQPWEYVGRQYERYIWMDANIYPRVPLSFDPDIDITCLEHQGRNCIYDEYEVCVKLRKDNPAVMKQQVDTYRNEGYPENNGLVQTGLMIRKLNEATLEHGRIWSAQIQTHSRRDQLSFNYALWKTTPKPTLKTISWEDFIATHKIIPHKHSL